MRITLLKIECLFFSALIGLTFGVLLAVISCVSVFVKVLVTFPIELYNIRLLDRIQKRLDALSVEPDDIWSRHIQRMEQNKTEKNDEEL
jgi:hypothetical protein|tara:strand:- start:136 stop:402 length:267 start_codon:yes stop_codon:yes gene_type:complete